MGCCRPTSVTFLPRRAVCAIQPTAPHKDPTNGLNGYIPRTYNWGVALTRPKYSVHVNWNYRSKCRASQLYPGQSQATTSIEPGTYQRGSKRLYVDLSCDYAFTKKLGVFASFRNLTGEIQDVKAYGPSTRPVARLESRGDYGGIWAFGLKGRF